MKCTKKCDARANVLFCLTSLLSSELPAESCKEIKASEGEQAVSGKYWFDSIRLMKTILAHCDMGTEGSNKNKLKLYM